MYFLRSARANFHEFSTGNRHLSTMHAKRGMLIANMRFQMNKTWMVTVAILLGLLPTTASAQTGIRPPQGWSLGFMGGAAAFSDMQRGVVRVFRPTPVGLEERELARRVGAETSTTLGGYIAFWPSRNWGLRLHGTYSPTRFETLMKESEADYAGLPQSGEGERLASLGIVTADLHALIRMPTIKNRVMLYGIIGGGVARYSVQQDEPVPEEARGEFDGGVKVRPAGLIGLGSMLPMSNRAFRLHFELTNHLAGTPLQGGSPQATEMPNGTIVFDPADEPAGDRRVSVVNGVRFMVGLSWSPRH
jgi:hypothetical protein